MRPKWIDARERTGLVPTALGLLPEEPSSPCTSATLSPSDTQSLSHRCSQSGLASSRGTTLLELVAALVLLAIISAVVISRRSSTNYNAYADAEALKGALRYARSRAMSDIPANNWAFQVNVQTGTYLRNGVAVNNVILETNQINFATNGVASGTTTFDYRGQPSGNLSFAVNGYANSPVTVTAGTGYVP